MEINGSVIVITSATSTLGSTLAAHFSSLGAKIFAIDTDVEKLNSMRLRCKDNTDNIILCPITDNHDDTVQTLFAKLTEQWHLSIDVLINYWPSTPLPMLTSEDNSNEFSNQLSMLTSPIFSFGQAAASHMRNTGKQGLIINMMTYPFEEDSLGFESARSMVTGFTKSWAKELDSFNIRVGGVIPGVSHILGEDQVKHWATIQDELIRSAEYIVSNEYFNGRVMAAEV